MVPRWEEKSSEDALEVVHLPTEMSLGRLSPLEY